MRIFLSICLYCLIPVCVSAQEQTPSRLSLDEIKQLNSEMQFLIDWGGKHVQNLHKSLPNLEGELSNEDNAFLENLNSNESTQQVVDSVNSSLAGVLKKSKEVENKQEQNKASSDDEHQQSVPENTTNSTLRRFRSR